MKKLFALLTVFVFAIVLAGMVCADERSAADKLASGREYLQTLDQKIIKYRKLGNAAVVTDLQAQKKSTIARMKVWKEEMEAGEMAPPPPPRPVAPPPVYVRPVAAPVAGLFGLGLKTGYTVGYLAGNQIVVGRGDLILADPMGIGPMMGLADDAIAWKLGLGGATGKDINDLTKSAMPIFVDGIINIPADMMGGVASYVGGGLNYVVYGSEKTGGSYGGQVYYGIKGDIGLGGDSYVELAYSIIRSGSSLTTPYSMKGIGINIGTELTL
ncbi:hypothetical protein COT42_05810 [Candidatus Saganbacteria bacterium CG08_land_8_20_14_0_20_45_16]|uniref:Outer membrane protein beta-barrel domain-containing protein n=1 Tax=Candidatus Saganbacteria bacterium CG08_land_8_20_14_0_20_45_16 TaxID=2014293 RepID=A0A2H0XYW7_UNCSA|nr:MAG: hypothetical protein COT42_05810 [Candidatus Saganbacteria bacterium CG08_land_8_20_14_0_20_45_16]